MNNNVEFGKKLHMVIGTKGKTIRGLADLTGIPVTKIGKWCAGMETPTNMEMTKIALVLKISTTELSRLLKD